MRLIDADALKFEIKRYANEPIKIRDRRWDTRCIAIIADMNGIIDMAQTVDAIVRCDRCKHWDDSTDGRYVGGWCFCDKIQISTAPDWFCADGERGDESDEAD